MARTFNGTSDVITCSRGGFDGLAFYGTIAAVVRVNPESAAERNCFHVGASSGSGRIAFGIAATTDILRCRFGATVLGPSTITCLATDGWVLLAMNKPTGTQQARFHKYVFSTRVWTHENSIGTGADAAALSTADVLLGTAGTSWWAGDIAVVGAWHGSNFADQRVEALAGSLQAWWSQAPTGLWVLDQDATTQNVVDHSGGGANQTAIAGTTVATVSCPLGYGQDVVAA